MIERELKCLMSGNSGESNSAYYLDFRLQETKNWVLIHDLRIEHKGLVAQIDHLLIGRFLEMYVLESKNYYYGIKITDDGEFLAYNGKGYQGIESPIEQNKRHIQLLQKTIGDRNLAPKRLGLSLPISFKNYVLVAPTARVDRPDKKSFDTSKIIKADAFITHLEKENDKDSIGSVLAMTKIIGTDTLEEFAQRIIRLHRPGKFNYAAKFGIDENSAQAAQVGVTPPPTAVANENNNAVATKACDQCGAGIEVKVVYYCHINKAKFNGKVLCRDCQQLAVQAQHPPQQPAKESNGKSVSCELCSEPIDSKVVYFCRINKKKFDGKTLCRHCQQKHSK